MNLDANWMNATRTMEREPARRSRNRQAGRPEVPSMDSAALALDALEQVSRRMDVLARELNCLGYFGDDDGPRAA